MTCYWWTEGDFLTYRNKPAKTSFQLGKVDLGPPPPETFPSENIMLSNEPKNNGWQNHQLFKKTKYENESQLRNFRKHSQHQRSQKRHCSCLAQLWHSEALQKHNFYAITGGMTVLPHQSHATWPSQTADTNIASWNIRPSYQWDISKSKLGDFPDHVYRCRNLLASPDFHFQSRNLAVPRSLGCRRWWTSWRSPWRTSGLGGSDLSNATAQQHHRVVCCKLHIQNKSFQVQQTPPQTRPWSKVQSLRINFCPMSSPQREVQCLLLQDSCWEPCTQNRVPKQIRATVESRNEGNRFELGGTSSTAKNKSMLDRVSAVSPRRLPTAPINLYAILEKTA